MSTKVDIKISISNSRETLVLENSHDTDFMFVKIGDCVSFVNRAELEQAINDLKMLQYTAEDLQGE